MAALASVSTPPWIPEDDLLLKNAVEAGASLEALAKGAVQFSRRFTVQELKNRWYSLLYDPDISANASARMVELEPPAANLSFKSNRLHSCRDNVEVLGKRKVDNIRRQYHAMQKRIRGKPSNSADVNLLMVPSSNGGMCDGNGCEEHMVLANEPTTDGYTLGNHVLSHFGFQDSVPEDVPHIIGDNLVDFKNCSGLGEIGPLQASPDRKPFDGNDLVQKPLSTLDSMNQNLGNICSEFGGRQHCDSPVSDGSASRCQMGFPSPLPRVPLWKTIEDIPAPVMPIDVNMGNRTLSSEEDTLALAAADGNKPCSSGYGVQSEQTLKDTSIGLDSSAAMTDGEFADLPDSLLNFTAENELLFMEADVKNTMDKSCDDNLESVLLSSPDEVLVDDLANVSDPKTLISGTSLAIPGNACRAELGVRSEVLQSSDRNERVVHPEDINQHSVHSEITVPLSTSIPNPHSPELLEGKMICTLNTEDHEIPDNDDIFLPATLASVTQPTVGKAGESAFSPDIQKDREQASDLTKRDKNPVQSLKTSQMIGKGATPEIVPDHQFIGCNRSELSGDNCLVVVSRHANSIPIGPSHHSIAHASPNSVMDGELEGGVLNVKSGEKDAPGTSGEHLILHAVSGSPKMDFLEPVVNSSISDQEESGSDEEVPYFSDIEAMILEMDLCPDVPDSYTGSGVSRYQSEDAKRAIIRLEQFAQSSMQRVIASQGALAIFYGRHLKYYLKKAEVILGRATAEVDVDIDLGREGLANKISRRQAIIKMEGDGSFALKNIGKNVILLNGQEIATGQVGILSSSSLIEIRGMRFVFEVNHKSVRQYLVNVAKRNQVKSTNFEWSPDEVPRG